MKAGNGWTKLENTLFPLSRLTRNGLAVDFVTTSAGLVRIGSMPDISKFCRGHRIRENLVVVPAWQASMAGDNFTGEEFVLWDAQVSGGPGKTYVGQPDDIRRLHDNLDLVFSFYFDARRLRVVRRNWLDRWFVKEPAVPDYRHSDLTVSMEKDRIILTDRGDTLYDSRTAPPAPCPNRAVAGILSGVARDTALRRHLEIIPVGTGNGFTGTVSSCLVRFQNRAVWIDPGGYPAHGLARHGIHWDDVTDIFITHNHEDHVQGISACLFRARERGVPLHLITAGTIFTVLRRQFTPLFTDFDALVNWTPVQPGTPLLMHGIRIDTRWNHHILPYGTLGLKITAAGRTFGYSGDTKLDETLNRELGREDLMPAWFADCNLLFHEISFDDPMGVHTFWTEVEKLGRDLPCPVLGYHTGRRAASPVPLAEAGRIYRLD